MCKRNTDRRSIDDDDDRARGAGQRASRGRQTKTDGGPASVASVATRGDVRRDRRRVGGGLAGVGVGGSPRCAGTNGDDDDDVAGRCGAGRDGGRGVDGDAGARERGLGGR